MIYCYIIIKNVSGEILQVWLHHMDKRMRTPKPLFHINLMPLFWFQVLNHSDTRVLVRSNMGTKDGLMLMFQLPNDKLGKPFLYGAGVVHVMVKLTHIWRRKLRETLLKQPLHLLRCLTGLINQRMIFFVLFLLNRFQKSRTVKWLITLQEKRHRLEESMKKTPWFFLLSCPVNCCLSKISLLLY